MVFSFTTNEDRDKLIGYRLIWVFNQCCMITKYEDCPHIFACQHCRLFAHKICDSLACMKCGSREHSSKNHPADLPLHYVNCRKEHAANHTNCNGRRCLLGLNPLPEVTEAHTKKPSRSSGKKPMNKPKTTTSEVIAPTYHVAGFNGNQLLGAINKDNGETPMKLWVSSAIHEKAQDQVNRSSQRLWEKAAQKQMTQPHDSQNTHMEGILADPSQTSN